MESALMIFNFMALGSIGTCIGFLWADMKFRQATAEAMDDERRVLKDALKSISETHNALVGTQARLDQNIIDLDTKVGYLMQTATGGKR